MKEIARSHIKPVQNTITGFQIILKSNGDITNPKTKFEIDVDVLLITNTSFEYKSDPDVLRKTCQYDENRKILKSGGWPLEASNIDYVNKIVVQQVKKNINNWITKGIPKSNYILPGYALPNYLD